MARSLRSFRQVATLRHGHMARRSASFAPVYRALGVCEHTISSPKIILAQNKHFYNKKAELGRKFATW